MQKIKYIITILFYIIICFIIFNSNEKQISIKSQNNKLVSTPNIKEEQPIGTLIINKININKPLYQLSSTKNNIEENITILDGSIEPNKENSIMFIAAHSGTSKIAFFNNLNQLQINDEIILYYNNVKYLYAVKNIWETKKDGNIEIIKDTRNQLILTTCSTTSKTKQLIINCIKKES